MKSNRQTLEANFQLTEPADTESWAVIQIFKAIAESERHGSDWTVQQFIDDYSKGIDTLEGDGKAASGLIKIRSMLQQVVQLMPEAKNHRLLDIVGAYEEAMDYERQAIAMGYRSLREFIDNLEPAQDLKLDR